MKRTDYAEALTSYGVRENIIDAVLAAIAMLGLYSLLALLMWVVAG